MHGDIRAMLQQGHFQFFREESFGQRFTLLRQRNGLQLVSGRLDDLELESQPGKSRPALRGDGVGLRESEGAASGGEDDRLVVMQYALPSLPRWPFPSVDSGTGPSPG